MRRKAFRISVCMALGALGACGACMNSDSNRKPTITLSCAASTSELVDEVVRPFQAMHAVDVKINAGPSNTIARQAIDGAPVDLLLLANDQWTQDLEYEGLLAERIHLFSNRMVLIVPTDRDASTSSMDLPDRYDLEQAKQFLTTGARRLSLAGSNVPAGIAADEVLTSIGCLQLITSEHRIVRGQDVRMALRYVELGEADAGVVYFTDARANSAVRIVHNFDRSLHAPIEYVLIRTKLKNAPGNRLVSDLFKHFESAEAQKIYDDFGFAPIEVQE
jgi:molybdate transport system substrate-binding protein